MVLVHNMSLGLLELGIPGLIPIVIAVPVLVFVKTPQEGTMSAKAANRREAS